MNFSALQLLTALTSLLATATVTSGHRCYVCKSDNTRYIDNYDFKKMFGSSDDVRNCNEYTRDTSEEFVKECPKDHRGCLTKFQSGSILRTCARVAVDACKKVNQVMYCYCKTALCNSPDNMLPEPPKQPAAEKAVDVGDSDYKDDVDDDDDDIDYYYEGSSDGGYPCSDDDEDCDSGRAYANYGDDYADTSEPTPSVKEELEDEYQRINDLVKKVQQEAEEEDVIEFEDADNPLTRNSNRSKNVDNEVVRDNSSGRQSERCLSLLAVTMLVTCLAVNW